ncbi:MAG TPA: hypothetical protein PKD00_01100 [Burkholderiales bacterium]|nr:hypothetical protein [Burkholderiales bacterium]
MKKYNDKKFLEEIIVPLYWSIAHQDNIIFNISDMDEQLILTSKKYANSIGFNSIEEARNKKPGIDYPRCIISKEHFLVQKKFLESEKKAFDYVYKMNNGDNNLYLSTVEPIISPCGTLVGKKEIARPMKLLSCRDIIENHFNNKINSISSTLSKTILLTEKEEIVLFMLIAGYSQLEIANYFRQSRSNIAKIIDEHLCVKFEVPTFCTKSLIEKAIAMGYSMLIPDTFLAALNMNLNI